MIPGRYRVKVPLAPCRSLIPDTRHAGSSNGSIGMLSKSQVIDAIRRLNPTAPMAWLAGFELTALRRYYEHLLLTLEPRGSRGWIRAGETAAISTRRPAA